MPSLLFRFGLVAMTATALVSGQCTSLLTHLTAPNGQSGCMFDITAINAVSITSFDANIDPGTWSMSVYYVTAGGTMVGQNTIAANWTLAGSATVTSLGLNLATPLPIPMNVAIPAGATQGFYVTETTATPINYGNGTAVGAVYASDANIQFKEGYGNSLPLFGGIFQPRVWSGRINYSTGFGGAAWQVDQPEATMSLGGTPASACSGPASFTTCAGSQFFGSLSSILVGYGWEVAFHLGNAVPGGGGGLILANGDILNLDVTNPTLTLLHGGTLPPFPGPMAVPVLLGTPVNFVAQMAVFDPTTPGGIRLSAATELHIILGGSLAGPISDDSSVTITLGGPLCGPAAIPFFGVSYSQMHVISNGRVMFTGAAGNTTFTPSVAQALTDQPFVGAWCDLNPAGVPAGTITVTSPASDQVQVNYNGVVYFATAIPNTFSINFNATTGAITIQNLTGLGVGGTASMFLGISKGNLGATDPGVTPFAIGGPNTTGNGTTDMIYKFGVEGPGLAGGANNLTFTPNGLGGYTWAGS